MNGVSPSSRSLAYQPASAYPDGLKELDRWILEGSEGPLCGPLPKDVTPQMAAQRCLLHAQEHPESVRILMQNAEIIRAVDELRNAQNEFAIDRIESSPSQRDGSNSSEEDFDGQNSNRKMHEVEPALASGGISWAASQKSEGAQTSARHAAKSFCTHFKAALKAHWKTVLQMSAREGLASLAASVAGIAAMMLPPKNHAVGLTMAAMFQMVGGGIFGNKLGHTLVENRSWSRHAVLRHVPGVGLGLACAAGAALTALQYQNVQANDKNTVDELQSEMVKSLLFINVYSGIQALVLFLVGKRVFPHLALPDDRKLKLTASKDTALHGLRLVLGIAAYFLGSLTLGSLAGQSVNAAIPLLDSDSAEATWGKEMNIALFRSLNEALDALCGALALLATFGEAVRQEPRIAWKDGYDRKELTALGYETASREFMNLTAGALSLGVDSVFGKMKTDEVDPRKAFLAALTHVRGCVVNALPAPAPPLLLSQGHGTRADGNCLLHAVAGEVDRGEWRLQRPGELRRALAGQIRARENEQPVIFLARHYLQEVASFLGNNPVHDGANMRSALPASVITRLVNAVLSENAAAEGRGPDDAPAPPYVSNAIEDSLSDAVDGIANYYAEEGRHLPSLAVPLLAAMLRRPLALHDAAGVRRYDEAGRETQDEPLDMVHIRHRMVHSEVGHFERVERNPAAMAPDAGGGTLSTSQSANNDPTESSQLDDLEEGERKPGSHVINALHGNTASKPPSK